MKKLLIAMVLIIPFTANAAFLTGGTDVGSIDTFLAQADKVGNTDAEAAWASGVIGTTVDWSVKLADVSYEETTTAGVFAFDVLLDPEYFIVKNATQMALFRNLNDINWGVFDTGLLGSNMNLPSEGFTISHVTSLNGSGGKDDRNIPEPIPLALLGAGLLSLGGARKVTGK